MGQEVLRCDLQTGKLGNRSHPLGRRFSSQVDAPLWRGPPGLHASQMCTDHVAAMFEYGHVVERGAIQVGAIYQAG